MNSHSDLLGDSLLVNRSAMSRRSGLRKRAASEPAPSVHTEKKRREVASGELHGRKETAVSIGCKVVSDPADKFDRFVTQPVPQYTPALDPKKDAKRIEAEFKKRGYVCIRVMSEEVADDLFKGFNEDLRRVLSDPSPGTPRVMQELKEGKLDLSEITATNIPMELYPGRMGSGKMNGNRLPHSESLWQARIKYLHSIEPLYGERMICPMQNIITNGPLQHSTLVEKSWREEFPRALAHFDYGGPPHKVPDLKLPGAQGILQLTAGPAPDDHVSGTVIFPRSHLHYEELRTAFRADFSKGDGRLEKWLPFIRDKKIGKPVLPILQKGCAVFWSLQMLHAPHAHFGPRLSMPITAQPRSTVPLTYRVIAAMSVLTGNCASNYNSEGPPTFHPLYRRSSSKVADCTYLPLWGVRDRYFTKLAKLGIHHDSVTLADLKKHFTPFQICNVIESVLIRHVIGIDWTKEEAEAVKKLTWKEDF